jgi:inositol-phosphate phosphatase/L-galactose 1-phosphate phosphatase/histidinol-phosphatase
MPADLSELAGFAEALADAAGPLARRFFRQPLAVESKADLSPVTEADRGIERLMRDMIGARYPGHAILGEEFGAEGRVDGPLWVLDPIDGTKSFITGMPTFGTLIAYLEGGRPLLGVVDMPALGERWVGMAGGTRWDGVACRTSLCAKLSEARLYATSPDIFAGDDAEVFERVSRRAGMRRFGGDCYAYGLLAGGQVDAVLEAGLQPYDFASLVPVIEGAGGVITDWAGQPLGLGSDGRVAAAATSALHSEILAALDGASPQ